MVNSGAENSCGFSDDIVSYMYGEIDAKRQESFESHLSECSSCTDEFADVADARYSVFEWQKEAFSHLVTPEIVVPYPARRHVVEPAASGGSIARLIALFTPSRVPLAAAAAVAIVVGLGFAALQFLGTDELEVASNISQESGAIVQPSVIQPAENPKAQLVPVLVNDGGAVAVADGPRDNGSVRAINKAASEPRRGRASRPASRTVRTRTSTNLEAPAAAQVGQVPVLSSFEDTEDRSLRLADLFDDDGAGG